MARQKQIEKKHPKIRWTGLTRRGYCALLEEGTEQQGKEACALGKEFFLYGVSGIMQQRGELKETQVKHIIERLMRHDLIWLVAGAPRRGNAKLWGVTVVKVPGGPLPEPPQEKPKRLLPLDADFASKLAALENRIAALEEITDRIKKALA